MFAENTWVAIEIARTLSGAGDLSVGGVNLLEHQIAIAKQLAPAERILALTPQGDETLLQIISAHGIGEIPPFEFIMLMRERVQAKEEGAVVLLRQIAPLRDAADVRKAVAMLEKHTSVVSASKPPAGHARHKPIPGETEPDYRCLAFEVRRMSAFSGAMTDEEQLLFVEWDSFAELLRPQDAPYVEATMRTWVPAPKPKT